MYPYNILSQLEINKPIENTIHNKRPPKRDIKKQQIRKQRPSKHTNNNIDEKLIELLSEAIEDKKRNILYYTKLLKMSKIQAERSVINEIRMDEHKHERLLRKIYYAIVGIHLKVSVIESEVANNIKKEYEKSIFEELKSMEFYKKIYVGIKNQELKNMLYDIITDEQAHSIKLTYLNSLYK